MRFDLIMRMSVQLLNAAPYLLEPQTTAQRMPSSSTPVLLVHFRCVELSLEGWVCAASLWIRLLEKYHKNTAVVVATIAAERRCIKYGILVEVLE
jgi:hypothetical protein